MINEIQLTRRRALALLAGTAAAIGTSQPEPPPLNKVGRADVVAYLRRLLDMGFTPKEILERAMEEALNRCALTVNPHAALLPGPAIRLNPDPKLALWVLFHVVDLSPSSTCPAPSPVQGSVTEFLAKPAEGGARLAGLISTNWREALAQSALVLRSDPHPVILSSEVSVPVSFAQGMPHTIEMLGRVGEVLMADAPLSIRVPTPRVGSSVDPNRVAQWIHGEDMAGFLKQVKQVAPDSTSLWAGAWLAAGQAQHGTGGTMDGTHCVTTVAALQRLARLAPMWSSALALSAGLRIAHFGPEVNPSQIRIPKASVTAAAWEACARDPGADVHRLKFGEALLRAPAVVAGDVRRWCVASRHFQAPVSDPRFDALWTAFKSA